MTACNVIGAGMVTPVGYNAPASCAAIRAGLSGIDETHFLFDDALVAGGIVPLPEHLRGRDKLLAMAVSAVQECLEQLPLGHQRDTALWICLSEAARVGRIGHLDRSFAEALLVELGDSATRLGSRVIIISEGAVGGISAVSQAMAALSVGEVAYAIVVGVDSLLTATTLAHYHRQRRLLTELNKDGFFAGEAAAAILLAATRTTPGAVQCVGVGVGREPATVDSDVPLRGQGTAEAYRMALQIAGRSWGAVDYRMANAAGEEFAFKDAALGLLRVARVRKEFVDFWLPAESVGHVGAAALPLQMGIAWTAATKRYAPGPGTLIQVGDDDGRRGALLMQVYGEPNLPVL